MTEYKRGEFREYRAVVKVHLGKFEHDVHEGDIIEFDGQTVRHGGEEYALSTIRAAIDQKWFVPVDDAQTTYVPKSAGIKIRPAQSADAERGAPMEVKAAADEERLVGTLDEANLGHREGQGPQEVEPQEGQPIRKLSTPTKQATTVSDSTQASKEIRRLDNMGAKPQDIRVQETAATGDVEVATSGEDLTDLLPGAAVVPQAAPKVEKKASGRKGNSGKPKAPKVVTATTKDGTEIKWDLGQHWKTRAKTAIAKYGGDAQAIEAIMTVETKGVAEQLASHIKK